MANPTLSSESGETFSLDALAFELPESLIAQQPLAERDASRLLVVDRASGELVDAHIRDLPDWLLANDLLVLNDTRVLPARFFAHRASGGSVGGLFLDEVSPGRWHVMLEGSRRLKTGETLTAVSPDGGDVRLTLVDRIDGGNWSLDVAPVGPVEEVLSRIGRTPLPPYIRRDRDGAEDDTADRLRYQTVYAASPGAIAAPTAGLHLTPELLERVRGDGVATAFVTLHVGAGTFQPIRGSDLASHVMHTERYALSNDVESAVGQCRSRGGRIVAVGTTSVRVLESAAADPDSGRIVAATSGSTDIFIYPPYRFAVVDALLTNFHLPKSTLLALVMAMGGVETIRRAYSHAVEQKYRFYSYGDAMLIV